MRAKLSLLLVIMLLLSACSPQRGSELPSPAPSSTPANTQSPLLTDTNDEAYKQAMDTLSQYSESQPISDFLRCYDILTNLPTEQADFLNSMRTVDSIVAAYDISLKKVNYFLSPNASISSSEISKYIENAQYDIQELIDKLVYPAIYAKHSDEVQHIAGLTYDVIVPFLQSDGYSLEGSEEKNYICAEEIWRSDGSDKSVYSVTRYPSGMIYSIEIPIIQSSHPLSDSELREIDFSAPQVLNERISAHLQGFSRFRTGSEILNMIFAQSQLAALESYLKSLTCDYIWAHDMLSYGTETPDTYFSAAINLKYTGTDIILSFKPNSISMKISGTNFVNEVTHQIAVIKHGLLPEKLSSNTVSKDALDYNYTANSTIYEWQIDFDALANEYAESAESAESIRIVPRYTAGSGEIVEGGFVVSIPGDWRDKVYYETVETDTTYGVAFYEVGSRDAGFGGHLFTIWAIPDGDGFNQFPSYEVFGKITYDDGWSDNLLVVYPTDVQFSTDGETVYRALYDQIPNILNEVAANDGFVYAKLP